MQHSHNNENTPVDGSFHASFDKHKSMHQSSAANVQVSTQLFVAVVGIIRHDMQSTVNKTTKAT